MPQTLNMLVVQLREIWRRFGVNQKVSILSALALTLAVIGGLLFWSARPEYRLLYSGLSLKDAAAMREKLDEERVRMVFKDSGRSIHVPAKDVYRARLLLAAEGFPKETATGFELFEQPKFGLTDFAQKVNYQRALQGELERTIASMDGIQSARVMLVLPEERLFAARGERRASASVLLTLAGGMALAPGHVRAITHLIGGSVPGLDASAITITDHLGNLLARRAGDPDDSVEQSGEQFAAQQRMETMLASKAQALLDRALGDGRSVVKVNVLMDFSRIEKRSERFDAENKTVRSETVESESTSAPGPLGGSAAGAVANIPIGNPGAATAGGELSKSKKENVRTEYAVPSDVEHMVRKGATIRNVSVSVCVAKGKESRSAGELTNIEQLVTAAVGLVKDETRQDTISVVEMDFPVAGKLPDPMWWERVPVNLDAWLKPGAAVLALLFLYALARRSLGRFALQREDVGIPVSALGEHRAGRLPGNAAGANSDLEELTGLAERSPHALAAWVAMAASKQD